MHRRSVSTVFTLAAVCALTGSSSGANAASGELASLIHADANLLAARIEADAHRTGPSSIKRTQGCCHVRILVVGYNAPPAGSSRPGGYTLVVFRQGNAIEKLGVDEYLKVRHPRPGDTGTAVYNFDFVPGSVSTSVSASYVGHYNAGQYITGPLPAGVANVVALTPQILAAFFTQAMTVVSRAEHKAPVHAETYLHPNLPDESGP